ncbi:TrkH family potassium uptake protein [Halofilum ochraceum]|uniref:TrkH family potassium uptake protein n=1 Tax=Halofilum ochraceum TaxID=1611323 RepID=UPI0008D908AA|nr:TrkH family potassium uptake protein [Halofilum ochraceum]
MHFAVVQKILGGLLILFSITMLPPVLVALIDGDGSWLPFLQSFGIILLLGLAVWLPASRARQGLRLREGFIVVALFWTALGLAGSFPLILSTATDLSVTDAAFEAISGLTTTGSTVIVGLDNLPRSILFYRQQLQWLGGMGIIVLAVAILPMLGIGGMQLYRAEMPGPVKDNKLTPRIAETAKALWVIYVGLTGLCAIAYWLAGMTPFDALGHSFSTVAIGGFSTYDASMGHFDSALIEMIAVVFMVLGGTNFALHFAAMRRRSLKPYALDPEFRTYLRLLIVVAVITVGYLTIENTFDTFPETLHHGIFQVVSIATTTGFTSASFADWPDFLPVLLIFASFIGACASSTGGGLKVIRVLLLFKQGRRELTRLVHPRARVAVKIGNKALDDQLVQGVWGFFATYILCFAVGMLLLMAAGHGQVTAFSAMAATLNNLGPGLGEVASNFRSLDAFSKWVLCAAMLLGRLEIFTFLVLLTPDFWRR